jgi:hypothetical protein
MADGVVWACADELQLAKPNPNATPAPTTNFEPARKLRRDVASVAFSWVETSNEFLAVRMSKPFIGNFAPLVEFEREHSSARLEAAAFLGAG